MEIRQSDEYRSWFIGLRDQQAKIKITTRLLRIESSGQIVGDFKAFGNIIEPRFHFGPGYRIYATKNGNTFMLLLVGGDKSTQEADVSRAQRMAEEWRKQQ